MDNSNPTNADLYEVLGSINEKLGSLDAKVSPVGQIGELIGMMRGMIDTQQKTIVALIALAGATVGLKLLGSPPLQVILYYIEAFIFLFIGMAACLNRRHLPRWYFLLAFGACAGTAQVINLLTPTETLMSTILYFASNIALLLFAWGIPSWKKEL